jgi:hypothetical protein
LDDKKDKAVSDVDPDAVCCKKCQKRLRDEKIECERATKAELRQRERAIKAELLKAKSELPKPKRSHHEPKPKQPTQKEAEESEPVELEQPAQEEQLIVEQPVIPEYYKVHLRFPSLQQESEPEAEPIAAVPEPLDDDSPTIIYHSTLKRPKKRRKPPVLKRESEKPAEPEPLQPPEPTILAESDILAESEPEPSSPIPLEPIAVSINIPQDQQEPIESHEQISEEPPQEQQETQVVTGPEQPDVIVDPSTLTKLFGIDVVRKR